MLIGTPNVSATTTPAVVNGSVMCKPALRGLPECPNVTGTATLPGCTTWIDVHTKTFVTDIASGELQRLIGVNKVALNDLANRGVTGKGW